MFSVDVNKTLNKLTGWRRDHKFLRDENIKTKKLKQKTQVIKNPYTLKNVLTAFRDEDIRLNVCCDDWPDILYLHYMHRFMAIIFS